jgi:CelD/BcsL family acetyltransferase involved in cellulose biosynthesis
VSDPLPRLEAASITVEVTSDPAAFRAWDWSEAVASDPDGTIFHTPAWLKLWWEEFGTGDLVLAAARHDAGGVAAACAFEVIEGELRFLGGFDVTDYLGPVGPPRARPAFADGLARAVEGLSWTRADLRGIPVASPWLDAIESAAAARGWTVQRDVEGVAPLLVLPGSFETYLAGLPAKLRHEMRRKERRLREAGPGSVRLSTEATIDDDLERFLVLHRESPGPKGRFMHAGMELFFRRVAEVFLPSGAFTLAFMDVDGVGAAGAIGFSFGGTFSLYNSAFDRRFVGAAPGMVLVSELIRRAADGGCDRFDLLKGDLAYKYRFGASPRAVARLVIER